MPRNAAHAGAYPRDFIGTRAGDHAGADGFIQRVAVLGFVIQPITIAAPWRVDAEDAPVFGQFRRQVVKVFAVAGQAVAADGDVWIASSPPIPGRRC